MSVTTQQKRKEGGFAETRARHRPRPDHRARHPHVPVPAVQYSVRSMKATLLVGDYLFVSKYTYGYSRYSLPFSPPLFSGRILASEPKRGDVVVFRLPKDDSIDYIKRVIGLPGDRIQMIERRAAHQRQPVKRERIEDFVETEESGRDAARQALARDAAERRELHDARSASTMASRQHRRSTTVPAGHYFMMGDNRDNSTDSRVLEPGRLCAVREHRRPRRDHLLLGR